MSSKRSPLVEQLQAIADAPDIGRLARSMLLRIEHPMRDILADIPGPSAAAKARQIGCARQTYFAWRNGRYRPKGRHAHTIARLAGRTLSQVQGLDDL
jgi:hypothetical protein